MCGGPALVGLTTLGFSGNSPEGSKNRKGRGIYVCRMYNAIGNTLITICPYLDCKSSFVSLLFLVRMSFEKGGLVGHH